MARNSHLAIPAALIGAPGAAGSQGAVYVFSRAGDVWTEQIKLTAADGEELDLFGNFVSPPPAAPVFGMLRCTGTRPRSECLERVRLVNKP